MREGRRVGRPRAASREILEEAACELFLEKGYAETSVADITQRAGVSRNTFFNYIPTKSDLLWLSVDDAVEELDAELRAAVAAVDEMADAGTVAGAGEPVAQVRTALLRVAAGLEPGAVALALANAGPMGVEEELVESAARRQSRAGRVLAAHLQRRGLAELPAEVLGAAYAGALLAALRVWARAPVPRAPFEDVLRRALDTLPAARA